MKSNSNITNIDDAGFVVLSELSAKIITLGNDFTYYVDGFAIKVSDLTTNEKIKIKMEAEQYGKKIYFQCDYADYIWKDMLNGIFY